MKYAIVTIADSEETARALHRYLIAVMGDLVDSSFMTYQQSCLSGKPIRQADLFIQELFATDSAGLRAEGLSAAAKWLSMGKRALVISGSACAESICSPLYWDLASSDGLNDRIEAVIKAPVAHASDLKPAEDYFFRYRRPAVDPHRTS